MYAYFRLRNFSRSHLAADGVSDKVRSQGAEWAAMQLPDQPAASPRMSPHKAMGDKNSQSQHELQ